MSITAVADPQDGNDVVRGGVVSQWTPTGTSPRSRIRACPGGGRTGR